MIATVERKELNSSRKTEKSLKDFEDREDDKY